MESASSSSVQENLPYVVLVGEFSGSVIESDAGRRRGGLSFTLIMVT